MAAPSKDIKKFSNYLKSQGAEILISTNEWEVLRYRFNESLHIIYRKKTNSLTFTGESKDHFDHYRYGTNLPKKKKSRKRVSGQGRSVVVRSLLKRDGDKCFYCGLPLEDKITVEHLLNTSQGGNNHMNNLALAHPECNSEAGNRDIVSKVKLREAKHRMAKLDKQTLVPKEAAVNNEA